jgi:hypothetical protein
VSKRKKYTVELTQKELRAVQQSLLTAEVFLRNRATEQLKADGAIRDNDWADVHREARLAIESALKA